MKGRSIHRGKRGEGRENLVGKSHLERPETTYLGAKKDHRGKKRGYGGMRKVRCHEEKAGGERNVTSSWWGRGGKGGTYLKKLLIQKGENTHKKDPRHRGGGGDTMVSRLTKPSESIIKKPGSLGKKRQAATVINPGVLRHTNEEKETNIFQTQGF